MQFQCRSEIDNVRRFTTSTDVHNFWRFMRNRKSYCNKARAAIHNADLDGNDKTEPDATWKPLIVAPCFPSYASNHGSLSNAGAEVLRRLYGAGGHAITITNPAFPTLAFQYSELKDITSDIADARVYGGIHFRFDQDAGGVLGRAVGTAVYKNNLRPLHDQN